MQNVGQQYGQGGASSHQGATYGHTESSASGGSITSSLRQFRKKDVDKQHLNDTTATVAESHVARVAPHNHYPPRQQDCYRYPPQFPEYNQQSQVKYSEISDPQPLQDQIPPSVIQKAKGKDYMEMCNIPQPHMKQAYPDHLNQQPYGADPNIHPQYLQKDPQVHSYKPESQYFPKETQYQQLPHQMQKYNMPPQIRKYPTENDFLSKLRRIHPTMARSIMSEHHLQESQPYQAMDQNRMYPHQNQRYMNYSSPLQNNPYSHGYMPPQPYSNYPSSCSYTRPSQITPRFPSTNPHERSISPRRTYTEMPPVNYAPIPQRISPNYPQYSNPEYAQHYQHRRAPVPVTPQEYYAQHCRPTEYLPHQMAQQDLTENRVTVSDKIKQYIENWADEETAAEINQIESSRLCKENLRAREEQSTETVYMINASELQYLENGIPVITSENGIPLVASENGQYYLKSGVTIDNSTGMVRIIDKTSQAEPTQDTADRVVNVHIMDTAKPDCMLANKPKELNQRQSEPVFDASEKPKVVVHQNTIIQPSQLNTSDEPVLGSAEAENYQTRVGTSLPILAETGIAPFADDMYKACKKETVDKNCSPINMEQIEKLEEFNSIDSSSVICPLKLLEQSKEDEIESDATLKNMPLIDLLPEGLQNIIKESEDERDKGYIKKEETAETNTSEKNCVSSDQNETKTEDTKVHVNIKEDGSKDIEANVEDTVEGKCEAKKVKEELEEKPKHLSCNASEKERERKDEMSEDVKKEQEQEPVKPTDVKEESTPPNVLQLPQIPQKENETENVLHNLSKSDDIPKLEPDMPAIRRTRRIFSVDDIINNIGNMKPKPNSQLIERRRSIQITKDFLEKEVDASFLFPQRLKPSTEVSSEDCQQCSDIERTEEELAPVNEEMKVDDSNVEMKINVNEEEPVAIETTDVTKEEVHTVQKIESEVMHVEEILNESDEAGINKRTGEEPVSVTQTIEVTKDNLEEKDNQTEDVKDQSVEITTPLPDPENITVKTVEEAVAQLEEQEITIDKPESNASPISMATPEELQQDLNVKENSTDIATQNEVQYRNAIRVEENSVLLEIAGELVEITVNIVNGKKVIAVVPLSESTVVDFNDNYESLDATQVHESFKASLFETETSLEASQLFSVVEVPPEPDIIESTSEVIIGMDISLEEEIQLDLEKPQSLSTKAAKKCYDNDLQIPSITTSDDITENNKANSYSPNDKVSSSKEQRPEKLKSSKKKIINSSKKKVKSADANKSKDITSEKAPKNKQEEEEEFVPFKDLVKARKLKKQKQLQMKVHENVSADSTNKVDQEELVVDESEERDNRKDEICEESIEKVEQLLLEKMSEEKTEVVEVKMIEAPSELDDLVNEKKEISRNVKKVTFGSVHYKEPEKTTVVKNHKLEDPRLKPRPPPGILVPSVSELLKENERLRNNKKKLSLAEYISRKRKITVDTNNDQQAKIKKENITINFNEPVEKTVLKNKITKPEPLNRAKMKRPKSLDDIKLFGKPKDPKRKLSLEVSSSKPNHFDWEETQSPKTNSNSQEDPRKRVSEFSGLINNNKSKVVVDVSDLSTKTIVENSEDEILQNYKEQVDSKLSSLTLQIPRVQKPPTTLVNPFSSSENVTLMQRFLKNEKLTSQEMETIKNIISYKRLMHHLEKIKSPSLTSSPLSPTYEIRKPCCNKDMKLHLKKISEKKKQRFRNLNAESTSESESDFSDCKKTNGDYSVVQSNSYATAGVPKLIIKRKTEMPLPVVRLERLDLKVLVNRKRKIC